MHRYTSTLHFNYRSKLPSIVFILGYRDLLIEASNDFHKWLATPRPLEREDTIDCGTLQDLAIRCHQIERGQRASLMSDSTGGRVIFFASTGSSKDVLVFLIVEGVVESFSNVKSNLLLISLH